MAAKDSPTPEGIFSILDTDLYKLTMQCAVQKYYPHTYVTYAYTNRTPHMKLSREAFEWLQQQYPLTVKELSNVTLTDDEYTWLSEKCPFLSKEYLEYLKAYRFCPNEHVILSYNENEDPENPRGGINLSVKGLWIDTILYEIPLLALTSEAYFKFVDTDWNYDGQEESAYKKGKDLLDYGISFSEFGTRRRRSYRSHDLVMKGLKHAKEDVKSGMFIGSSNVHFSMKYGLTAVGTVAHEWFMGTAASMDDYTNSTEKALERWVGTFGDGTLGIALTDTFGTPAFLQAFARPMQPVSKFNGKTYAQSFNGIRQDSGDPEEFIKLMRSFYDKHEIGEKTLIFSDSLNVEKSKRYHDEAKKRGFWPSFGIGTFFTNDFLHKSNNEKSKPLNIVIKLASANGTYAVKLSDEKGKNTGDAATVARAKEAFGYTDKHWEGVDEASRW